VNQLPFIFATASRRDLVISRQGKGKLTLYQAIATFSLQSAVGRFH
jgi:hypothetical protein